MKEKYRKYNSIKLSEFIDVSAEDLDQKIRLCSLVTGISEDKVNQLSMKEFNHLLDCLNSYTVLNDSDSITVNNKLWTYDFSFDYCTVKQFVDIEIIKSAFPTNEAYYRVLASLIYNQDQKIYTSKEIIEISDKQVTEMSKMYTFSKLERHNQYVKNEISVIEKLNSNYEALLEMPIAWVFDKLNRFQESYLAFVSQWSVIFNSESNTEPEVNTFTEEENKALETQKVQQSLYSLLMLSVDDNLNFLNSTLEMSVSDWLQFCTYKIEQINREIQKQKLNR